MIWKDRVAVVTGAGGTLCSEIAIDLAFLLHPQTYHRYKADLAGPRGILTDFCRKTRHDKNVGEGIGLDNLKKSLRRLYGEQEKIAAQDLPEEFHRIPEEDVLVISAAAPIPKMNSLTLEQLKIT